MIVNSKISENSKQFWEGSEIQFLILFFTLLLHILYEKVPYTCSMKKHHQIHYASLEEVKKNHGKQFITVTTHKNVQNYYN